jgi:hypothetical protein
MNFKLNVYTKIDGITSNVRKVFIGIDIFMLMRS